MLLAGGCTGLDGPPPSEPTEHLKPSEARQVTAPSLIGKPDDQACEHPRASPTLCRPWAQPEPRPFSAILPYATKDNAYGAQWGAVYSCDALVPERLAQMMTDGRIAEPRYLRATKTSQCEIWADTHPANPRLGVRLHRGPWNISPEERAKGGSCWTCPSSDDPGAAVEEIEIAGRKVAVQTIPLADGRAVVDMRIQIPHSGSWVWLVHYRIHEYRKPAAASGTTATIPADRARARSLTEELARDLIAYDQRG
ncbi:hypothetical protein N8J89_03945 [Crossiella sp. CA-258035]|uniref:hypothetical protein n=1 Tax=Crossiella sp. CA-258035 TaxID=2981138 RepID=UPI0024BCD9EF|nr:hypothetical protein [Crossiella sp. CA-258035]WHT20236.1 hypothetical protein N8J89_03945 [Crossiella sp. CA-258035]